MKRRGEENQEFNIEITKSLDDDKNRMQPKTMK